MHKKNWLSLPILSTSYVLLLLMLAITSFTELIKAPRAVAAPKSTYKQTLFYAKHLLADQNYEKAYELLKPLQKKHTNDVEFVTYYAWSIFWVENHEKGIKAAKNAIQINPKSDLAHHYLGLMYFIDHQNQNAADEYRMAIKLNPKGNCKCGPTKDLLKRYPPRKIKKENAAT